MQYYDAFLLKSCGNESQWPDSDLPEIIFAGRSNAGKSTLINALVNRKNLAYSGKTPGKTRILNFFEVNHKVVFTDAPGYGYATSNQNAAKTFGNLIDPYFEKREQLKGMVLVLDSRRVPSQDDLMMIDYGRSAHLNILIVCTKTDKLSNNEWYNQKKKISKSLEVGEQAIIPVDSLKRKGLDEVWTQINKLITQ